jgi:hypothetical protein
MHVMATQSDLPIWQGLAALMHGDPLTQASTVASGDSTPMASSDGHAPSSESSATQEASEAPAPETRSARRAHFRTKLIRQPDIVQCWAQEVNLAADDADCAPPRLVARFDLEVLR